MEAHAALGGAHGAVVSDAEPFKNLNGTVVHLHGDGNAGFALGVGEDVGDPLVKPHFFRSAVEILKRGVKEYVI